MIKRYTAWMYTPGGDRRVVQVSDWLGNTAHVYAWYDDADGRRIAWFVHRRDVTRIEQEVMA